MRFADAFSATAAGAAVNDGDFLLNCACGLEQRLAAMILDEDPDLMLYDCARCENSVAGVMRDDSARRAASARLRRRAAADSRDAELLRRAAQPVTPPNRPRRDRE